MNYIKDIQRLTSSWTDRIDWDQYFMSIAFLIASRSPCDRLHVGCVLVKDTRIISVGYNGFLPKAPHISHVRNGHEQCTIHAEQNSITDCAKRGISCNDAIAYITHYPCINCAKILAAAQVKELKYYNDYKNDDLVKSFCDQLNVKINKI